MQQLRLSYTLLSAWKRGRKQEAAENWLRIRNKGTAGMNRGQKFDYYVKDFVNANNALPPELGGKKLQQGRAGHIIEVGYNERFTLKGEVDVLDTTEVIEVKCSTSKDAVDYSNDFQTDFYLFIAHLAPLEQKLNKIRRATIYCYNPQTQGLGKAIVYRSERRMNRIRKMIDQYGPEIYDYFSEQGLL